MWPKRYRKFGTNTSNKVGVCIQKAIQIAPCVLIFEAIISNSPFISSSFVADRADANCPINIDSKSYEITKRNLEAKPNSRYIFDEAAGHVYQLMKNDSYPRYLRSDLYKEYLNGTKKKVSSKWMPFVI